MDYALEIKPENIRPHLDIERLMQEQKNGNFTFTLRVNSGNIVDVSVTEYVSANKYLRLKSVIREELTFSRNNRPGNEGSSIWNGDI